MQLLLLQRWLIIGASLSEPLTSRTALQDMCTFQSISFLYLAIGNTEKDA